MFKILKPADFRPEIVAQIIDLGKRSGTWQDSDVEYYEYQFLNPKNINIIYQNDDGRISGYILARPHNDIVPEYLELDPLLKLSDIPMFYVDHVNVDDAGKALGMQLIIEMIKEANMRNVCDFSFHCRIINGLSERVQKSFKIYTVRRIEKYRDCNNEPFDYLEGTCVL